MLIVACALREDDYSSGALGLSGGGPAAGGSASGHGDHAGGSTGMFPDGGAAGGGTGGKSVGFPDGGTAMGGTAAGAAGSGGSGGDTAGAGGMDPAMGAGGAPMGPGGMGPPAPFCGDGHKDPGESCDGGDFAGATCASTLGRGDANGPLVCGPGCQIDTGGCVYCGDGVANNGENCNSCPGDTGTCCTSRCCDGSLTPTTGATSDGQCKDAGAFLCGALGLSRSTWNGGEVYPTYCQIKCKTFTTWHNVGAPDLDPPACSHDRAVAYCASHGGYTDGNIVFSACPM